MLTAQERKDWTKSRRQVDEKMAKNVGTFHPRVTRRVDIDLSHVSLAGLHKPISFTFIDPVFVWSVCAEKLSRKHKLYFEHKEHRHPVINELLYGASV